MSENGRPTGEPALDGPPHHRRILDGTDWASLGTGPGTGEFLPEALARLLDPDPAVRADAVTDALGEVTHQNTIYEATVPVARYVAAILDQPHLTAGDFDPDTAAPSRRPTLVRLLEWLGDTARDADDECVAIGERRHGERFLHEYEEMRAFRDLRPVFLAAVRPFLGHENADVRDAALVAVVPLSEHPLLGGHRSELADHARRLLATSTDPHNRDRALAALRAWGHDTGDLETADDVVARERYARGAAVGGYDDDPPF
ncbi:hypothetical protein ACIRL2_49470 [Embleya sp. NPDC127516]|uniref:hypothetical protein n=1 Tax=Embleya sp. NPDC127516 TaxID=3363990 RepID=UPI003801408E